MKYAIIKEWNNDKFRRLTGVNRKVFERMVEIIDQANQAKKLRGGRKNKLCPADMVLLALEYLREYRTYFHISQSYCLSESTAYKIIRWVEDTLIAHKDFALPGRKQLLKSEVEYEVIMIDATETPVERPKKNRSIFTQEKRNVIQ